MRNAYVDLDVDMVSFVARSSQPKYTDFSASAHKVPLDARYSPAYVCSGGMTLFSHHSGDGWRQAGGAGAGAGGRGGGQCQY